MDDPEPTDRSPPGPGDRLAEYIAAQGPPPGAAAPAGPCPAPTVLAGFAEGRLLTRERETAEGHLARCAECRETVADLLGDAADPALAAPPRPRQRTIPLRRLLPYAIPAAAALLLAAFLAPDLHGPAAPAPTEVALAAAARDLAKERPDLFGEFRPVRRGDPLLPAPGPKRGALAILAPAGKVLATRPPFRWEAVPGVARWRVVLRTAEGDPLWTHETGGPSLPFPAGEQALLPGTRYIAEVSGEGPLGGESSRRAFDVASDGERRILEEAGRAIDAGAPKRLRPLLRAHFALRAGLYLSAVEEAERFLRETPGDSAGAEALALARGALGEGGGEAR